MSHVRVRLPVLMLGLLRLSMLRFALALPQRVLLARGMSETRFCLAQFSNGRRSEWIISTFRVLRVFLSIP